MSFLQIIILAIVQGITEFLPISSSGHLILLPLATSWPDQGIVTDVMVHVGSLFAVIVYFWRDVLRILQGMLDTATGKRTDNARLFLFIAVGTIPALIFGAALKLSGFLDAIRANPLLLVQIVGCNAIIYGLILYAADRWGPQIKRMESMTWRSAIIIGLAQALALIPGTSRSGVTISAARFLGIERPDAARYSFLLGIPAISAAGLLTALEAYQSGAGIPSDALLAALFTFFTALLAIAFLMALIRRMSFAPFVLYRLVLGVGLLSIYMFWPDLLIAVT